ncbi:MAG TPA: hypothetical protein VKP58_08170 [Candidatus Acidoferrum sp.]|nr:hypothetical protein [Candidatus Acidoferrum sp.]
MRRAVVIVGAIAAALLFLFFGVKPAQAETPIDGTDSQPGDANPDVVQTFSPPPPDDFSNSEIGDVILGGSGVRVSQAKIDLLAQAIATAEGFFNPNPNVVPRRAHNPGNLTKSFGFSTFGTANSEGVLIFGSDDDGWSALKGQVTAMLTGASHVYSPSMTLSQVARLYTGGDNPGSWAANAASVLGITPDSTLVDFLER